MTPNSDTQMRRQTIGPRQAERLLEENVYEFQRPLSNATVAFLADQMRAGKFSHNTIVLGRVKGRDKGFLLNGQHTLWAVIESGVTLTLPLVVYHVPSQADLGPLYSTIDIGKQRSLLDTSRALGLEARHGLDTYSAIRVAAAVSFIQNDFVQLRQRVDRVSLLEAVVEHWLGAYRAFQAVFPSDRPSQRRLMRRDVLSVALVTFRALPRKAVEFWDQVVRDDGLGQYDARKMLNRYLLKTSAQDGRYTTPPEEGARAAALCWNAWWEGRSVKLLRVPNLSAELQLRGVPRRKEGS